MMYLYNYLAVIITERLTGLDHSCLKIWDFYTYVYTLSRVEQAMNIVLVGVILITICIIGYVVISKLEKKIKVEEI